ncbi:MAG: hypothetical protein WED87_01190, partial [Dehalococcoidia bacterium]
MSAESAELVLRAIREPRPPDAHEVETILAGLRAAEFPEPFLSSHHRQRLIDRQWVTTSSAADYFAAIQRATSTADWLLFYERRGGNVAATVSFTS